MKAYLSGKQTKQTLLNKTPRKTEAKNSQKLYAGYAGSSGVPLGDEDKYSKKRKSKKQKHLVYKIGMNPEKGKVMYHK